MRRTRSILFFFTVFPLITTGCSLLKSAREPLDVQSVADMPGPNINPVIAHFEKLNACVDSAVTASGEPRLVFGVGPMPNNTGRYQVAGEKGSGYPVTLQATYFISQTLEAMGFDRMTRVPLDLDMIKTELGFGKEGLVSDGKTYQIGEKRQIHRPVMHGQMYTYDVGLNGQFTSHDEIPGQMLTAGAYGAFIGKRAAGARIAADIKAFDPVTSAEYTTQGVDTQVVVHDYQAGVNRFLLQPMTILIGAEFGATVIGMHDIAERMIVLLNVYRIIATFYPNVAVACNQFTGGFMNDNPGARYKEPLVRKVFNRRIGQAIAPEKAKPEAVEKGPSVSVREKKNTTLFILCQSGLKDFHCVLDENARARVGDIQQRIKAGAEVKQIVGFTESSVSRSKDVTHSLTHAKDIAKVLSLVGADTLVRAATDQDLNKIHDSNSPIRGQSGVLVEILE